MNNENADIRSKFAFHSILFLILIVICLALKAANPATNSRGTWKEHRGEHTGCLLSLWASCRKRKVIARCQVYLRVFGTNELDTVNRVQEGQLDGLKSEPHANAVPRPRSKRKVTIWPNFIDVLVAEPVGKMPNTTTKQLSLFYPTS